VVAEGACPAHPTLTRTAPLLTPLTSWSVWPRWPLTVLPS